MNIQRGDLIVVSDDLHHKQEIQTIAHSIICINDGLLKALDKVCKQSVLGARIALEQIPLTLQGTALQKVHYLQQKHKLFSLCFTISSQDLYKLPDGCFIIGQMGCGNRVKIFANNQEIMPSEKGSIEFNNID
jgi:thiamine monophosphate kinase